MQFGANLFSWCSSFDPKATNVPYAHNSCHRSNHAADVLVYEHPEYSQRAATARFS
jgi:hypothetical protein